MLLTADVGNTEIVLGVFEGAELRHTWRLSTRPERTLDELALSAERVPRAPGRSTCAPISPGCVCQRRPRRHGRRARDGRRLPRLRARDRRAGTKTGVPVLTDNPREVGADRVVNTLAAFTRFGGPAIVVDFGTGDELRRGLRPRGVPRRRDRARARSARRALFGRTARLTRVDLRPAGHRSGKTTVEAIQSGLLYGTAGEVDGIVDAHP